MSNPAPSPELNPGRELALLVSHVAGKLSDGQLAALNIAMVLDTDPRDSDGFEVAEPLFTDTRTDGNGRTYPAAHQGVKEVFAAVVMRRLA